jgi:hypothetical protein
MNNSKVLYDGWCNYVTQYLWDNYYQYVELHKGETYLMSSTDMAYILYDRLIQEIKKDCKGLGMNLVELYIDEVDFTSIAHVLMQSVEDEGN